jgi:diguanylate cyclase (GGDEF)-like protein
MGILSAITPLGLALIMLVYLRQRRVYPGFGRWVLANFGLSLGYLLISLRDFIPAILSIVLGNAVIVYAAFLVYEGIEEFYGRTTFSRANHLVLGAYLFSQVYFTYFDPDINARVVLSSLALCILIFRSGIGLWRPTIPELATTSRAAAMLFTATAIFPLFRAVSALFQSAPIDFFFDSLNSWFALVLLVSVVGWTFYFFFLNSARLELELETARDELERIASTDSLTGLFNRRHFERHAEVEFERAKRYGSSLSFLLLDLDQFKWINDTYGHEAGDRALVTISAKLRSGIRSSDVLARLGGDEFVVMVVNADPGQVYLVAERLRRIIEETSLPVESEALHVQLSVGISCVEAADNDLGTTLKRGDRALYQAKQMGRNRIVES